MLHIIYMKHAREIGRKTWTNTLANAKVHAEENLAAHGGDRVEIREDNGKLVFHHPRALRAA